MTDAPDRSLRNTIQAVTPTVCRLLNIPPPGLCKVPALEEVLTAARGRLGEAQVDRCLVYAPDALGDHLRAAQPSLFTGIAAIAPIAVAMRAVVPPKTPVCFASMFTGAPPSDHGIRRYERPVLGCDTLFDALVRAGRRVAIVAVADSSLDHIFRGRDLDYFSEAYDPEVTARVCSLLEADRHEFILAYHQEYDDQLHETTPLSAAAVEAAHRHVAAFRELAGAVDRCWSGHDRAILFAPDHGAHLDAAAGQGTHGEDIPEDMELTHFYGFARSGETLLEHPAGAAGGGRQPPPG